MLLYIRIGARILPSINIFSNMFSDVGRLRRLLICSPICSWMLVEFCSVLCCVDAAIIWSSAFLLSIMLCWCSNHMKLCVSAQYYVVLMQKSYEALRLCSVLCCVDAAIIWSSASLLSIMSVDAAILWSSEFHKKGNNYVLHICIIIYW